MLTLHLCGDARVATPPPPGAPPGLAGAPPVVVGGGAESGIRFKF